MGTSFLAQLMGLFSIGMGFSMLARREMLTSIFQEVGRNRALAYILGVLIFQIGLLLVLLHTTWNGIGPTIITLIGWGVLLEGTAFLFMSHQQTEKCLATLNNGMVYYGITVFYLTLGCWLTYFGFTS